MAFIDFQFSSKSLGKKTEAYILIPQEKPADGSKFKCLYLLHGLSDDHTTWMRRTSIERYADKYGICVVMPNADISFYTDMKYGLPYYTYIAKELPELMQSMFGVSDKRKDNFVAGLSMGGYGALKIALRECDRFCAGAGLSAATDMDARRASPLYSLIFGENAQLPQNEDLFALAKEKSALPNRPRIYLGVGTEDFLYEENQKFKAALDSYGYDVTYRESHGTHNWDFWDEYIQYVLEWMFGKP